jgi:hypothetical protein
MPQSAHCDCEGWLRFLDAKQTTRHKVSAIEEFESCREEMSDQTSVRPGGAPPGTNQEERMPSSILVKPLQEKNAFRTRISYSRREGVTEFNHGWTLAARPKRQGRSRGYSGFQGLCPGLLNSLPGFQVGRLSPLATVQPTWKRRRRSSTAPDKSQSGLMVSETLW